MCMYFYIKTKDKCGHTIDIRITQNTSIHCINSLLSPQVLCLQQMDNKLNNDFPCGLSYDIKMTFTTCFAHYSRRRWGSGQPVFSPQPAKLLAMVLITSFQSNYH